jgi:hypothetical protein
VKDSYQLVIRMVMVLLVVACNTTKKDQADYEIAAPVYVALTQKSLDYLANFELDSFAEMLDDSVAYELPDGTKMMGKTALVAYWQNHKQASGIQSMKITDANYLPVNTHTKHKANESLGVKVVVDFTNNMVRNNKEIAVKMNFSFHFNHQKLIDQIDSNYDQTLL